MSYRPGPGGQAMNWGHNDLVVCASNHLLNTAQMTACSLIAPMDRPSDQYSAEQPQQHMIVYTHKPL